MISVVICSKSNNSKNVLLNNLKETIGVEYEIIAINNSKSKYSIFSAYNLGVKRSKFPIICFMHEDLKFHTKNWGQKVIDHFKESEFSMLGVAGSDCILKIPGTYSTSGIVYWNLLQSNEDGSKTDHLYYNPDSSIIKEVYAIDGLWFCVKKKLFDTIKFDDERYSGFHFYDFDISMQLINHGYKIGVIYDVLMEHFSYGKINLEWLTNSTIFFNKWSAVLPLGTEKLDKIIHKKMIRAGLLEYISFLNMNQYFYRDIDKFVRKYFSSIFITFNKEFILSIVKYYLLGSKKFNILFKKG